jgi:hypothetical protein
MSEDSSSNAMTTSRQCNKAMTQCYFLATIKARRRQIAFMMCLFTHQTLNNNGFLLGSKSACFQRLHVKDVYTLQSTQQFKSFQTSGLLFISRNFTRFSTFSLNDGRSTTSHDSSGSGKSSRNSCNSTLATYTSCVGEARRSNAGEERHGDRNKETQVGESEK